MKVLDGQVIIFPTDTVYGIGCKLKDSVAQKKIYNIKHRSLNKRLALLCANLEQINEVAYVTDDSLKLINAFLPGGLSIILKTKESYMSEYVFDTIAVRIPNHDLAINLLLENGPMTTTSVNLSNEPSFISL